MNIWSVHVSKDITKQDGILDAIAAVEENGGPLSSWERLSIPESRPQRYFDSAIKIALLSPEHEIFSKYIDWTIDTASKALDDERFSVNSDNLQKGWMNPPFYPANHGKVRAIKLLATALAKRQSINDVELMNAAHEIFESSKISKGSAWNNSVAQENHLYAVRLSIISGNFDEALRQLTIKKGFKFSENLQKLLLSVTASITGESNYADPLPSKPFEDCFQAIRPPSADANIKAFTLWEKHCFRLEMALIRERIRNGGIDFPDWGATLDAINGPDR